MEIDLIWMVLVIFLPTVFAIALLFFPKGWEEAMRWWSLFGTALTLGVSLGMFYLYWTQVVDHNNSGDRESAKRKISLVERAAVADAAAAQDKQPDSQNWLARYPWIPRFHIDFNLGSWGWKPGCSAPSWRSTSSCSTSSGR